LYHNSHITQKMDLDIDTISFDSTSDSSEDNTTNSIIKDLMGICNIVIQKTYYVFHYVIELDNKYWEQQSAMRRSEELYQLAVKQFGNVPGYSRLTK